MVYVSIKSLPDLFNSAAVIADSPTKSNSAIVITCELDRDNNCISYFNKQKKPRSVLVSTAPIAEGV